MRRAAKSLSLPVAILVAICLAAGAAGCAGAGTHGQGRDQQRGQQPAEPQRYRCHRDDGGPAGHRRPGSDGRPQRGGAAERRRSAGGRIRHQPPLAVDPARRRAGGRPDRVDNTGGQARLGDRNGGLAIEARRRVRAGLGPARRDERARRRRAGWPRRTPAPAGADIQRRADDLAQTLYALRESVPDPADQMRIADTLASLQAARSAMDAERAPGGAGPWPAEIVAPAGRLRVIPPRAPRR